MTTTPHIRVTYKSETPDSGSVHVIDVKAYENDPVIAESPIGIMPYGYKPQGVTDLGWMTEGEALAVAKKYDVELEAS